MSARVPLRRWQRPRRAELEEGVYPFGSPSFYPFPTVSEVVNATFCPVAAYHDLLHGTYHDVTSPPDWPLMGVGELFHNFIAYLKSRLAGGGVDLDGSGAVLSEFNRYSRRYPEKARESCWRFYLQPWVDRKFEELLGVGEGSNVIFEITASHPKTEFTHDGGKITYPLDGRADEMDVDNKTIVERTIKGDPRDSDPPLMKDYQLWLIWKVIRSVRNQELPEELRDLNFEDFDLVVETPYRDFRIEKENSDFEGLTHEAYAWIHDIAFDRGVGWDAYRNRRCGEVEKVEECGLRNYCIRKRQPYPRSRDVMSRVFREMYRPLFWEQMWDWHFFKYQLLGLPPSFLEERGLILRGEVVSFSDGKMKVKVPNAQQVESQSETTLRKFTIIPFGNLFLGKRLEASFQGKKGSIITLQVPKEESKRSEKVVILAKSDVTMVEARPWYLPRILQRDMHSLEFVGAKSRERANKDSIIQLLEAIFGQKAMRGGVD